MASLGHGQVYLLIDELLKYLLPESEIFNWLPDFFSPSDWKKVWVEGEAIYYCFSSPKTQFGYFGKRLVSKGHNPFLLCFP